MAKITVLNKDITVQDLHQADYISLTDIAKFRNAEHTDDLIRNWLRNRNTIEFIGIWESLNNLNFNPVEFDGIKMQAGLNSFSLTPKQWIEKARAIGIVSKTGRYGGTFAHKGIALEFAAWISVEFKLYLIKEFQRLKDEEQAKLGWSVKRELAAVNYRIHTDAIKQNLIPATLTRKQTSFIYANEADVLNMALFGMTAKDWRDANSGKQGNIRDHASMEQLICLSNLESLNAVLINEDIPQSERLIKLNRIAIEQMRILTEHSGVKRLK